MRGGGPVVVEREDTLNKPASRHPALVTLLVLGILGASPAQASDSTAGQEYGRGAIVALGNLFYGPVKLIYATGGAIVAGFAWIFSAGDADVTRPIADASLRGDYVITSDHLQGKRPLEFIGRSPVYSQAEDAAEWQGGQGSQDGTIHEGF